RKYWLLLKNDELLTPATESSHPEVGILRETVYLISGRMIVCGRLLIGSAQRVSTRAGCRAGARQRPLSDGQESPDDSHDDQAVNEILDIVRPQITQQPAAEVESK